jgi:hypothetical protein
VETTYLSGGTTVGSVVEWPITKLEPNEAVTVTVLVEIVDPTINKDYGVRAAGGISAIGQNSVSTEVTYLAHLPLIHRIELVYLSIWNDNSGGDMTINIFELGEAVPFATCTVPNNATQFCASFPIGTYNFQLISPVCPPPRTVSITFEVGGPDTRRVFCN